VLEKIESAYLAAMRVVVLLAATVALVVCVVGATLAAPGLLRQLGFDPDAGKLDAVGLAGFIQEQKIDQNGAGEATAASEVTVIPGKIASAANLIAGYVKTRSHSDIDLQGLQNALMEQRDAVPQEYQAAFEHSLLGLATELKASTGRALPLERVVQLLDWHHSRFIEEVEAKSAKAVSNAANASVALLMAGAGLIAFILILFFFLFVRIERNLRIVRTREVTVP